MEKFSNPLDNLRVASPCSANWDEMVGSDRKRFCGQCQLNVYNLSGMTAREAENLLLESEGRVCVRFYRRKDGTILTENCPVGGRAVKRRLSRAATAVVSMCVGIFGGLFAFNQSKADKSFIQPDAEAIPVKYLEPPIFGANSESFYSGEAQREPVIMGGIEDLPVAGMPVNLDSVRKDIKIKRKKR